MSPDGKPWLLRMLASAGFLGKYPGYASVVERLDVMMSPDVYAMAVEFTGTFRLHVNPVFFDGKNARYFSGVLLHEVHHIVFNHFDLARRMQPVFPDLFALALECSANEYINEPLPEDIVRWEQFAHLGVAQGQSAEERYEILAEARRAGRMRNEPCTTTDDHRFLQAQDEASLPQDTDAAAALAVLLAEAGGAAGALDGMAGGAGVAATFVIAGAELDAHLRQLSNAAVREVAAIDWRRLLAPSAMRSRGPDWQRANRRYPGLTGQVPGHTRRRPENRPHVLAAIDTSGSMNDVTLAAVAKQMQRLAVVADTTVVECDHEVQRCYRYMGNIEGMVGGGGTDLRPVFDNAFLAEHRPDALVYFTDGDGAFPSRAPQIPVFWVLTDDDAFACAWGAQLRLFGA